MRRRRAAERDQSNTKSAKLLHQLHVGLALSSSPAAAHHCRGLGRTTAPRATRPSCPNHTRAAMHAGRPRRRRLAAEKVGYQSREKAWRLWLLRLCLLRARLPRSSSPFTCALRNLRCGCPVL